MNNEPEHHIVVTDGNFRNPRKLNKAQYDALVASGMMWEFHPGAPAQWPDSFCEGCGAEATNRDSEGVPLCKACYDDLPVLPATD